MPEDKQRLELSWHGKNDWENPEPRLLIKKETYCSDYEGQDDNLLIHGDNLLGLKALERDYVGKVKCIYIDPPYNTRSLFTHYKDNLEHSVWLNMMKERLIIMRDLLREDGSIWISIDDRECHYLKVMCDEIFGRENFIANVIWERAYAPINLKKTISRNHDSILIYSKTFSNITFRSLKRTNVANSRYKNTDNDSRGSWMSGDLSVGPAIEKNIYPITNPSGKECWPPVSTSWRLSKDRFKELSKDNRIWFGKDGNNAPRIKRFLSEVKQGITPMSIWKREEVGDTQESKREAISLNPDDPFPTPKPERLLQRIVHLATNPGDIVLDSFAGSGTTGAVAHKMGRKWIMIELGDHCHTHIVPRMEKVINGEDEGGITKDVKWECGGGFEYCDLAHSL